MFDGRSSRRTLTTALLDLASRDEIGFVKEEVRLGRDTLGVELREPATDDRRVALNRRSSIGEAETSVKQALSSAAPAPDADGRTIVKGAELLAFGKSTGAFDTALEQGAVDQGLFTARPNAVFGKWLGLAFGEGLLAVLAFIAAATIPASGLTIVAVGILGAAVITGLIAGFMPARTMQGAMTRAMLSAYRRTLAATLAQARSMDAVVAEPTLAWLQTPDRAIVWSTALGLADQVQQVLDRSVEDVRAGRAATSAVYYPAWYSFHGSHGSAGVAGSRQA